MEGARHVSPSRHCEHVLCLLRVLDLPPLTTGLLSSRCVPQRPPRRVHLGTGGSEAGRGDSWIQGIKARLWTKAIQEETQLLSWVWSKWFHPREPPLPHLKNRDVTQRLIGGNLIHSIHIC